jgi:DNA-binding NarL/FixJ family response regulator
MTGSIALAEANDLLRHGLQLMLERHTGLRVVAEARDSLQALKAVAEHRPDVLLFDPTLPGLDGIEAVGRIKERWPSVRVLAFTERRNIDFVRGALRAGVDAYLLKNASLEELLLALGHVLAGKKFLSAELSSELVQGFLQHDGNAEGVLIEGLTPRERRVLTLVAEGCTSQSVATLLQVSRRTVEKQRAHLMRKLGLRSVAEVVLFAMDAGLVKRPEIGSRQGAGRASSPGKRGAVSAERTKARAAQ